MSTKLTFHCVAAIDQIATAKTVDTVSMHVNIVQTSCQDNLTLMFTVLISSIHVTGTLHDSLEYAKYHRL